MTHLGKLKTRIGKKGGHQWNVNERENIAEFIQEKETLKKSHA